MTFEIPNELSIEDKSNRAQWLLRNINVFFNGVQQTAVARYNISESWVQYLGSGYGQYRRIVAKKIYGKVEVTYKNGVGTNRT